MSTSLPVHLCADVPWKGKEDRSSVWASDNCLIKDLTLTWPSLRHCNHWAVNQWVQESLPFPFHLLSLSFCLCNSAFQINNFFFFKKRTLKHILDNTWRCFVVRGGSVCVCVCSACTGLPPSPTMNYPTEMSVVPTLRDLDLKININLP